jgi:hypothetical protein
MFFLTDPLVNELFIGNIFDAISVYNNPTKHMNHEFEKLSLIELEALHKRAERELHQSLINGDSWQDVRSKRQVVTQIAIHLHRKRNPVHFPGNQNERRPNDHRNRKP